MVQFTNNKNTVEREAHLESQGLVDYVMEKTDNHALVV